MRPPGRGYLGIDAGGTRTVAVWLDDAESVDGGDDRGRTPARRGRRREIVLGPANLQLISDVALATHLRRIAKQFKSPKAICIGMAGARTDADRERIRKVAGRIWPRVPCVATNDLEIALEAGDLPRQDMPAVLVLSGTGSCCYGKDARGRTVRVGGWGHILGDQGSAYQIAVGALRGAVAHHDRAGEWGLLGEHLLAALGLHRPDSLIGFARDASKTEIAALAPIVFEAATARDAVARATVREAAADLADAALACARRLAPNKPVHFLCAGAVFLRQPGFFRRVSAAIRAGRPGATISILRKSGAEGAARLARRAIEGSVGNGVVSSVEMRHAPSGGARRESRTGDAGVRAASKEALIPVSCRLSPTEERHPRSMDLHRMKLGEAIELMISEDERIPSTLRAQRSHIERAIGSIVRALRRGGRLFYVGAGTSGRLGILDASECPPTFSTPPELVQGIIAGGVTAVFRAVEGAEDDVEGGREAIRLRRISPRDVVVGIAASGRTPFVWGALDEAIRRGADTILICFNPYLQWRRGRRPKVVIAPEIGPEILTGSTRLKAGTATKMILNMFTTLAMVRLGKVVGNLMVDLSPSNVKLRDRAVRITRELTGVDSEAARAALERAGWVVKRAVQALADRRGRTTT